ncbi:MAG: alpha/beta hydrolase [Bacteroidota bacterium]
MSFISRLSIIFFIICFVYGCQNADDKKTASEKEDVATKLPVNSFAADTIGKPYIAGDKLTYEQAYDKALALFTTPIAEQYVKTRFGKAHIIVSGPETGEPLVLLHGMNASSTMWYPNMKALSENYRVYAIDCFLEPGKSQCIGEVDGMNEIIDWYLDIFDTLHLKKINLIGASRGGWLSVNIALRDPARIKKLVLLSPAQTFGILKPGLGIYSDINYSVNPKRANLRDFLETMSSNVDNMNQIFINQYYLATQKAVIDTDILKMQPFLRHELKSLNIPILVLIGDMDIINGEMGLRRAKRLCPNAQTAVIGHAGHFVSMDQAEVVNKKVIDFLNK